MTPDSESVLDRLEREERDATKVPWTVQRYPNRTLLGFDGKPITAADKYFLALSRNHLRALLDVARAADQAVSSLETWIPSESSERLRRDLSASLDPLLTTPSEQKEETA